MELARQSSFTGLVQHHGSALNAYVTRLCGADRDSAQDVVQETWMRAWRNLDGLTEEPGAVRSWLERVADNVAVDLHHVRRAQVEVPVVARVRR